MRTTLLAFSLMVAALAARPYAGHAQEGKLNPGDEIPAMEITLKNVNGANTSLKQAMKPNGLLVMFSCNTCPYVIRNQSITKKTIEYASLHNIGMVIINSNEAQREGADSYEAMKKYAKEQGYTVSYLADENSKMADLFGANHTPEVFLFNNRSKLVYKGAMNDNPSNPGEYKRMYIEDAINSMLAGKEVDPKITKSIGCSIKRKA
jgi:peroxiredoxin